LYYLIVNFYPYEESYDETQNYCFSSNPKIKISDKNEKLFLVKGGVYGGHAEYSRSRLNVGERYIMKYDSHLSSKSYILFYKDILRKWFLERNIIEDVELNETIKEKIKNGLEWEQMKYDLLIKPPNDLSIINNLCYSMISDDKIDFVECERKFKELNNEIINKNLI
jgi:hypothetical protein